MLVSMDEKLMLLLMMFVNSLKAGIFNQDIVDIIVQAAFGAMKLSFNIYQNNDSHIQERRINYEQIVPNLLCSHYDAVVLQSTITVFTVISQHSDNDLEEYQSHKNVISDYYCFWQALPCNHMLPVKHQVNVNNT